MNTLSSAGQSESNILKLLPPLPDGWEQIREERIYTPETLYEYINGGAELYLSYDMLEVASRIIQSGDNEIRIEVFDMQEARNAFGVFSHTRTEDEGKYGQGSQYFTGTQLFWKGKYFVALTANDENDQIIQTLDLLATQIDKLILKTGELPELIHALPAEGLLPDGFVYFHHYIWLNSYYYIANTNILNISSETDAILAKYGDSDQRCFLLLIKYPDAESCATASANLADELFEGKFESTELESDRWMTAGTEGNYLAAVFNVPSGEMAHELLESCLESTK